MHPLHELYFEFNPLTYNRKDLFQTRSDLSVFLSGNEGASTTKGQGAKPGNH